MHSQFGQEQYILALNPPPGLVIEAGAGNGVDYSNSLAFERAGWPTICIEPRPEAAAACRSRRTQVIEAALAPRAGFAYLWDIRGFAEEWSGLITAYDPRHWQQARAKNGRSVEVRTITLASLPVPRLLFLDTEGGELDILRATPQLADLVCVENNYLDKRLDELMLSRGYRKLIRLGVDDLWMLKSGWRQQPPDTALQPPDSAGGAA